MLASGRPGAWGQLGSPARDQRIDDPEAVAPLYARAIDHFGVKRAQRMLGLKIHTPGPPANEALADAARRHHLSAIRLTVK